MACAPNPAQSRLVDPEYTNWLKAGQGLIHLRNVLAVPTERVMIAFFAKVPGGPGCACSAGNIKKRRMQSPCRVCDPRYLVIRQAHNETHKSQPGQIFWKNSKPSRWHSDYWEVAKCYLGPGQNDSNDPKTTDCSNILTLWLNCSEFGPLVSNPQLLKDVRTKRNELFHSPTMKFSDAEVSSHFDAILDLLKDASLQAQTDVDPQTVADLEAIRDGAFNILTAGERQVWEYLIHSCQHNLNEFKDLKRFLDENPDLLEQLEQIGTLRKKMSAMQQEIETQKTATATLGQETGNLRQDMDTQKTSTATLEQETGNLRHEMDTHKTATATLQQDTGNLRQEMDTQKTTMATIGQETGNLRQEMDTQKTATATLGQDMGILRQEAGGLRKEMDTQNSNMVSLKKKMDTVQQPEIQEGDAMRRCLRAELANTYLTHHDKLQPVLWADITLPINIVYQQQSLQGREGAWRPHDRSSDLKDIFEPSAKGQSAKRIVIEGAPGMGKTTLCQHLVQAWALTANASQASSPEEADQPQAESLGELEGSHLHDFHLFFSLRVRDLVEDDLPNNLVANLLDDEWMDRKESLQRCIRHNKVLLVLDGYDEGDAKQQKCVDGWMVGKGCRGCTVIVTSRPGFCRPSPPPDTTYRLEGLNQIKQHQFAEKFDELMGKEPGGKTTAEQLIEFQHLDFFQFPLMIVLFCVLAHQGQSVLPKSVTGLYTMFVEFMSDKAMQDPLNFSDDYLLKLQNFLQKVAFDLLELKKSEMTSDILRKHISKTEIKKTMTDFCKFGLVCQEIKLKGLKNDQTGTFIHQSFLDYFSALHFMSLSKEERAALLDTIAIQENMLVFVAGMCGESEEHRECFSQMIKAWKRALERERKEKGSPDHSILHACLSWVGELQDPAWLHADHVTDINQLLRSIDLHDPCTASCLRGSVVFVQCAALPHDSGSPNSSQESPAPEEETSTIYSRQPDLLSSDASQQCPAPLKRIRSEFSTQRDSLSGQEQLELQLYHCQLISTSAQLDLLRLALSSGLSSNVCLKCPWLYLPDCLTRDQCKCLAAVLSRLTHLKRLDITVSSWDMLNIVSRGFSSESSCQRFTVHCSPSSSHDSPSSTEPLSLDVLLDNICLSELRDVELYDDESTLAIYNRRKITQRLRERIPPRIGVTIYDIDLQTGHTTIWRD